MVEVKASLFTDDNHFYITMLHSQTTTYKEVKDYRLKVRTSLEVGTNVTWKLTLNVRICFRPTATSVAGLT